MLPSFFGTSPNYKVVAPSSSSSLFRAICAWVLGSLTWAPKEFLDNFLPQNCCYILCTLVLHEQLFSKLPVGQDWHADILILKEMSLDIFDFLFYNDGSSPHLLDCHFGQLYISMINTFTIKTSHVIRGNFWWPLAANSHCWLMIHLDQGLTMHSCILDDSE
jgi:hypothetical protein